MPFGSDFVPLWPWLGYIIMYGMEQSDSVPLECLVACCSRNGLWVHVYTWLLFCLPHVVCEVLLQCIA